ncbi:hypothetical protein ABEB36_011060 [Hypothenemus hampei]|uniref:COX assembly mitochondrial protein n=1 Tax=Hypothenemus hampei TaxID=57062 RepID=A0ABD1EEP7_HYPHA
MHTDLSPHLHTDKCNDLIRLFRECRIDHPLTKFVGKCDHEYIQMTRCLKQERINKRQRSIEMSKVHKKELHQRLRERAKLEKNS